MNGILCFVYLIEAIEKGFLSEARIGFPRHCGVCVVYRAAPSHRLMISVRHPLHLSLVGFKPVINPSYTFASVYI